MKKYWINIYPHGRGSWAFDRRESAILYAKGKALYMIRVTLKWAL